MKYILLLLPVLAHAATPPDAIRTRNVKDICTTRTSTVRNVPLSVKLDVYKAAHTQYGVRPPQCPSTEKYCYEVDHIVPLTIGGGNARSNLKLQPYFGPMNAHDKDRLENKLHELICNHTITPQEAQDRIHDDWLKAYDRYMK